MAKSKKRKLEHASHVKQHPQQPPLKAARRSKQTSSKLPQPTIPFSPEDRILLIGEGDFSFARSIVEYHGCCDVTATCLDSKEELFRKYCPQGEENVRYLEEESQMVLYGVDATMLDHNKHLKKAGGKWEVIVFNFPHVGGKTKDVNRQVRFNQELLVNFFKASVPLLSESGTIVVTLFEGEPYTLWNIRDLARHSGLEVQRSFKFMANAYAGYSHARTLGNIENGRGWKGEDRDSRSYIFRPKGRSGDA
ncbi:hypothetical protein M433DRAFT_158362 [Acidomyces richmondensis BFW]|nr:hypothetical protein M433DRAFT_158362 [Acidomyces richmondensis BFW]